MPVTLNTGDPGFRGHGQEYTIARRSTKVRVVATGVCYWPRVQFELRRPPYVAYGLRMKKVPKAEAADRVTETFETALVTISSAAASDDFTHRWQPGGRLLACRSEGAAITLPSAG